MTVGDRQGLEFVDRDGNVLVRRPVVEPGAEFAIEGPHALGLEGDEVRRQRQVLELLAVGGRIGDVVRMQVLAVVEGVDVGDAEGAQLVGRAGPAQELAETGAAGGTEAGPRMVHPGGVHGRVVHVDHIDPHLHVGLGVGEEDVAEGGLVAAARVSGAV